MPNFNMIVGGECAKKEPCYEVRFELVRGYRGNIELRASSNYEGDMQTILSINKDGTFKMWGLYAAWTRDLFGIERGGKFTREGA